MKNGIYLTLILGVLFASLATDTPAQTDNSGADDNNGGYGRVYQSNGLAEATLRIKLENLGALDAGDLGGPRSLFD